MHEVELGRIEKEAKLAKTTGFSARNKWPNSAPFYKPKATKLKRID